ncbi:MAG: VWA domain-containing protein [Crocinitomicaceae bacterium]|nr:VWA domain-containing protein [Crocinitomicaceae bacterium]MBK8926718.1 VWA domain-containing protein [Crocinitomicaceae bacterium]
MKTKWITISAGLILVMNMISCGGQGSYTKDEAGYYENTPVENSTYVSATEPDATSAQKIEAPTDDFSDVAMNTEEYAYMPENDFLSPLNNPLSTFSIDVDNASYTNVRRMLNDSQKPPVDAVRSEEFINYFDYNYPVPAKEDVFSVYTEVGDCPWNENNKLVHIGLQGYTIATEDLPASNLVFLLDVSGSMNDENKLPLLKKSFKMLVDQLTEKDKVSIVTYAGEERVVMEGASCSEANKNEIKFAIDNLSAGGSTNGEGGINKAYDIAVKNLLTKGNNRVILATDGDFNMGQSSDGELTRLIEEKRDQGVYLTILGFGMGNYKDSKMESLADNGNGNYFYIDDISESNRVLVTNLAGTLFTIAKDVKIQVEFNPEYVAEYRLIGYENRLMNAEDFEDDKKDAGELGAGHTVTAIYEIVPGKAKQTDLKYQQKNSKSSGDLATIKLRYKKPNEDTSILKEVVINKNTLNAWEKCSDTFRFSVAVAGFSLLLRESKYIGDFTFDDVLQITKSCNLNDQLDRIEFTGLVNKAKLLFQN